MTQSISSVTPLPHTHHPHLSVVCRCASRTAHSAAAWSLHTHFCWIPAPSFVGAHTLVPHPPPPTKNVLAHHPCKVDACARTHVRGCRGGGGEGGEGETHLVRDGGVLVANHEWKGFVVWVALVLIVIGCIIGARRHHIRCINTPPCHQGAQYENHPHRCYRLHPPQ
jgi:hypothetical protein